MSKKQAKKSEKRMSKRKIASEVEKVKGKRSLEAQEMRDTLIHEIHKYYWDDGETLDTIYGWANYCPAALSNKFHKLGLSVRDCAEVIRDMTSARKYGVWDDAFSEINDEITAYWLGFLWADGRVLNRTDRNPEGIRVVLKPSDDEHLRLLLKFLRCDRDIDDIETELKGRKYPQKLAYIYSTQIAKDLISLGMKSNRKSPYRLLKKLDHKFHSDFFRGLFDGDGHIQHGWRDGFFLSGWDMGICGSYHVVRAFRKYYREQHRVEMYSMCRNGTSKTNWKSTISGPRVFEFLAALYPPGCIGLKRKKEMARLLLRDYGKALMMGLEVKQFGDQLRFRNTGKVKNSLCNKFMRDMKLVYERKVRDKIAA